MAYYELWLTDDTGLRIADSRGRSPLQPFLHLTAARAVNNIGEFTLAMPATFDDSLLAPDRMVQVWRAPTGGRLGLWRVYLLRRWILDGQGDQEHVLLSGPDTNDLLRRRVVAAYNLSSQAQKTDLADDMMKEFVTEALSDAASPTPDAGTRAWSNLSVQADLGNGPTVTIDGTAFHHLLLPSGWGVLSWVARAARVAGTEVFFDIVPDVVTGSSITFQFQTFTGQPGQDVTDRVVFDKGRGNLRDPRLEYDYREEENYIYTGGQNIGILREIEQVYDSDRYSVSQWNRCEGFADARGQTGNGVREVGRTALAEGEPKIRFSGIPIDTAGTRFGRDWDLGYRVRARYRNREFDTIVRAVTLSVEPGGKEGEVKEDIRARLEYES